MSQQNKTQLQSAINTDLADNTTGAISAADIRNNFINATDSLLFNSGSQTFDGTLTISDSLDVTNFITASKISLNDGGDSVFVGEGAGLNDDGTDNWNVGIGVDALLNNTTGYSNTATGKNSLSSNIAGHNNTANGAYSLSANTNGTYNTATGISSLMSTTTGTGNTAKGAYSLQTNTTGFYNTAVGYLSMFSNVNGVNNTANGYGSLQDNTTGNYNTATGGRSLAENTTGDNNIAFGYESGRFITGGSTANAIANNSVYLGNLTKAKANNETNQIVIGYNTTGNGSNTVTIGNSSITNNYFNGDVSATSFTGNGATISGSLIASGSVVDFTDATAISGSTFSGSFVGDGSSLTGVTGEWDGTLNGNAEISGSLIASGSVVDFTDATAISGSTFSGSFVGDGSGLTGISSDPFPYTGSAIISGSLAVTGSNIDFVSTSATVIPTITISSADGDPELTIDSQTSQTQIDIYSPKDLILQGNRGGGTTSQIEFGFAQSTFQSPTINITSPSTTIGTNSSSTTTMNGILITEEYTVSSLPASPATGSRAHVTDSTLTTFYSPVTGSGANPVPVFYNGTQWVIA